MKRLLAILLLAASPAFAINDDPTELRSGAAPQPDTDQAPQPTEVTRGAPSLQPPPAQAQAQAPQPVAVPVTVQVPVYTPRPVYYYVVPVRPAMPHFHHHHRR